MEDQAMFNVRKTTNIDFDWKFSLSDVEEAKGELFDDSGWQTLNLPHDWSIEGNYEKTHTSGRRCGFLPTGVGWYRKTFHFSEKWSGKCIFIEFDGIYMNSDVWINGHHLGHRPYGYIGFEYELTPYLHKGANVIAVRADCSKQPSSRWYNGSGIYRHVWLKVTDQVHINHWGTYITSKVNKNNAELSIQIQINNKKSYNESIQVQSEIRNNNNDICGENEMTADVYGNSYCNINQKVNLDNPSLWSPDNPAMYLLVTRLIVSGKVIDEYYTNFGIRYFEFVPNRGFYLNGIATKFKGVCLHHDGGPVGAAVPEAVLEKRLKMLKEMGCNAIRTSHNPFSPEFYDLCDRLGFMVMDEAFDGWDTAKAEADYGLYFKEWWQKDLKDMVLRDRNHPCVILWSIGNEVRPMIPETTIALRDFVHEIDPTRPVTCGVPGVGGDSDAMRALLDVAGYNDGGGACFAYARDHKRRPDQCFIATEAPHTWQTRGFYRTQTWWRDKNKPRKEIPNLTEEEIFFDGSLDYSSSYDNSGVRTCARDSWEITEKHPYLCGEFRWTGFDYLGESAHWPARFHNCGVIDLANLKKDHFYLYQSMWTGKPMIHILPHWTHPEMEGVSIPVWVYTTCEEVELFLNGKSFGIKKKGSLKNLSWDIPYSPGELTAIGYANGKPVAQKSFRTAESMDNICLSADKNDLRADGRDVVQVTFEITDKSGELVPFANNVVKYIINGPGKLIGMENGDPLDLTTPKASYRKAFNGMGMGLVQSTMVEGDIELFAAGILGESVFKEKTQIAIALSSISLRGEAKTHNWKVLYTLDGSKPDINSPVYTNPFDINETTLVRAIILEDDKNVCELECRFVKGERPKVIDLIHGNRELEMDYPAGPFAEQIIGLWTEGKYLYKFLSDGKLIRSIDDDFEQLLGYWWYDFPVDIFEVHDYAGTGEIWFSTGEKRKMELTTQDAKELIIDVTDAIGNPLGKPEKLHLHRK